MQKTYNVYYNLGYWFLLLIALVFGGFYVSYFSVLLQPMPAIVHIHFVLMSLWIAMLITQPFLIKFRKPAIHRLLGKVSYVLVPLVLASGFLMIRLSYYRFIGDLGQKNALGLTQFSQEEILQQAAAFEAIAIFYLIWFALFYTLAVINRRRSSIHARYMLATALTLLGPTVDRIIFFSFRVPKIAGLIPIESVAFLIADLILILLLIKDYKHKRPTKTLWICLLVYITGQVLYFTVANSVWWQQFVTFIMKPAG